MITTNATADQRVNTLYYCKWTSGAKVYFPTLQDAISKAQELYVRTPAMSDDNYKYWLKQKQVIGMETTIDTEIFYTES